MGFDKKKDNEKGRKRLSVLNQDMNTRAASAGQQVRKIDTVEYQEQVASIYEYLKQGMASNELFAMLMMKDPEMSEFKFTELLTYAYRYAETQLQKDRDYVFQLHMARYEKMYEQSIVMVDQYGRELDPKPGSKDWIYAVTRYGHALKALKSKEELIGLHDKSVVLEFNDQKAIVLQQEGLDGGLPGYDLEQLEVDEMVELLDLIKQARTIPIEGIQRVTIKTLKIEINPQTGDRNAQQQVQKIDDVIDIKFEEMPEPVVQKFKTVEKKKKQKMPTSPIVIDDTGVSKKTKPKTAHEVAHKLKDNVMNEFRKKLRGTRGLKD